MAQPVLPRTTCPQCNGTGVTRAVAERGTDAVIVQTTCGLCGGSGNLPTFAVEPPAPPPPPMPPAPALEVWPLLIPLALFILFFLYLWL
jgi:hypothetical protein